MPRYTNKHFWPLHQALFGRYTQEELAAEMHRSPAYVNRRMTGREPWTVVDMDAIGRLLGIHREEYHKYFWEG